MNGDNPRPQPATDLRIEFIKGIGRLEKSIDNLAKLVDEQSKQLKQNNTVSKDLYDMMDAHYQIIQESIKKGVGVQMLVEVAKSLIPRRK